MPDKFAKPLPRDVLVKTSPVDVFPTEKEIPLIYFIEYGLTGRLDYDLKMRYIGAAIDYLKTKRLDKESCQARQGIDIEDAFAHLNYVVHNTFFDPILKQATLALFMDNWFDVVPPKHNDAQQTTTTQ